MTGIFIGYRRADSAEYATKIHKQLSRHFGNSHVFMDIQRIEAGTRFEQEIEQALQTCDFFVLVIGTNWLTIKDELGYRRIDSTFDLARYELEFALKHKLNILPILVNGAVMPKKDELPDEIRALAGIQASTITSKTAKSEIDQIAKIIHSIREKRQQKLNELTQRLIELSQAPNHALHLGDVIVIHYDDDERRGKTLDGFLPISRFGTLAKKLYDLVEFGVSIKAQGNTKPHGVVGSIKWKIQDDNSHVQIIIEDVLAILKLANDTSFESNALLLKKWLDR